MAKSNLVAICVGGAAIGIIAIAVAGSYISAANYGNRTEATLEAKYTDNENVLSSGYQQLQGVAGVTGMARDDQVAIFKAAIEGRYGLDGSKAVFQMIKESNRSRTLNCTARCNKWLNPLRRNSRPLKRRCSISSVRTRPSWAPYGKACGSALLAILKSTWTSTR